MNRQNGNNSSNNSFMSLPQSTLQQFDALGFSHSDKIWLLGLPAKEFRNDLSGVKRNFPQNTYTNKDGRVCISSYTFYLENGNLYELYRNGQAYVKPITRLEEINKNGYGIFLMPNKGTGIKKGDVTSAQNIFYETDSLSKDEQWEKLKALETELGITATVLETSKSLHSYMALNEPCTDLQRWEAIQERLIQKMGSDTAIKNADRKMRLAGFYHQKWDIENQQLISKLVELKQIGQGSISIEKLEAVLPEIVKPERKSTVNLSGSWSGAEGLGSIIDYAEYLEGYNPNGRVGWSTCKCPVHDGDSFDSLHINNETGTFKCWSNCDTKEIYAKAKAIALTHNLELENKAIDSVDQKAKEKKRKKFSAIKTYRQFKSLGKYTPNILLDQIKLSLPELIKGINFISSACKTGKTTAMVEIEKLFLSQLRKVYHFTYRNGLVYQTAAKAGIPHIHDFNQDRNAINSTLGIACCPDSAHLIATESIGENCLIVIDECDATLKHILEGGTLGDKQEKKLDHFKNFLRRAIAKGGTIVLMEDGLGEITLDSWRDIIGTHIPHQLIKNETYLSKWSVTIGAGSPSGFLKNLVDQLGQGKKIVLASDSQTLIEALERMLQNNGATYKVLRVDSKTVEEPHIKAFMADPQTFLSRNYYDLVMFSPTAESGLSIEIPGFDYVYGYFSHCTARQAVQLLERYRLDVPRFIYCSEGRGGGNSYNSQEILNQLTARHNDVLNRSKVNELFNREASEVGIPVELHTGRNHARMQENDESFIIFNRAYARYKARDNAAKAAMLLNLTEELNDRGHSVVLTKWEYNQTISSETKQAKIDIEYDDCCDRALAPADKYLLDEAIKMAETGTLSKEDRNAVWKTITTNQLPNYPLDNPDYVQRVITRKGRYVKQAKNFVFMMVPDLGVTADQRYHGRKLNESPFEMMHKAPNWSQKVGTLQIIKVYILAIMDKDHYDNSDPDVIALDAILRDDKETIKAVWKLSIREHQPAIKNEQPAITAVSNVNQFLRTVFGTQIKSTRPGSGNSRARVYSIVRDERQDALIGAIIEKHSEEILVSASYQEASAVLLTYNSNIKPRTQPEADDTLHGVLPEYAIPINKLHSQVIQT